MSENKLSVLIVDDEQSIRRFLRVSLESQKYTIIEASTGQEALTKMVSEKPEIVVLDLGLPDMDGVEVTRLIRQWSQIPIIILSVRNSDKDKIAALDAGADDYLSKPFSVGELLARLRVASRRLSQPGNEPLFSYDQLKVDLSRRVVTIDDRSIQLTPNEYDILKTLVVNAGRVLTHQQLLREVWGIEYADELHMLHVNISNLRRKIEPDPSRPRFIVTEPGVGYRLRTG
jgi:two-component system KDP operon response regulator KdpE